MFEDPYYELIKGRKVGLISNHTGVDSHLRHIADRLESDPEVHLAALFGPEHGFSGSFQAGEKVVDGPRVFSLYGEQRAPTEEMLEGIDILIFDIQDVGSRFYTYISTMFESMKAAGHRGIPFLVLDRPNPLGGTRISGPIIQAEFFSFVGIFSLPIRYGMTIGELAMLFNSEADLKADLTVVPLAGWSRNQGFPIDQLQWISPSPNMPTIRTAEVYPGFCLIEGTTLSEGRGTTLPFELLGAPWLNGELLAANLNQYDLPGVFFRPQFFTPTFSKYAGESCSGIQVHVLDSDRFDPIQCALTVIAEVLRMNPEEMAFRESHFDRLVGNKWVRSWLLDGRPVELILPQWEEELIQFAKKREKYYLY